MQRPAESAWEPARLRHTILCASSGRHARLWPACSTFVRHYIAPWQRVTYRTVPWPLFSGEWEECATRRLPTLGVAESSESSERVRASEPAKVGGVTSRKARAKPSAAVIATVGAARSRAEECEWSREGASESVGRVARRGHAVADESRGSRRVPRFRVEGKKERHGEQTVAAALAARLPILPDGSGAVELHLRARPQQAVPGAAHAANHVLRRHRGEWPPSSSPSPSSSSRATFSARWTRFSRDSPSPSPHYREFCWKREIRGGWGCLAARGVFVVRYSDASWGCGGCCAVTSVTWTVGLPADPVRGLVTSALAKRGRDAWSSVPA